VAGVHGEVSRVRRRLLRGEVDREPLLDEEGCLGCVLVLTSRLLGIL